MYILQIITRSSSHQDDYKWPGIHTIIPLLRNIPCDPEGVKYRDVFHQSNTLRNHLAP